MDAATDYLPPHRLTVSAYFRMAETGILEEETRTELINGVIIDMPPINSPHSGTVNRLTRLLVTASPGKAIISVQNPIILGEYNAPQPDFCVLKWRDDDYKNHHAQEDDVLLCIEVADSSLAYDRNIKGKLYAQFGIAEYWLIDIKHSRLYRHHQVNDADYAIVDIIEKPAMLSLLAQPTMKIDLSTLFD